MNNSSDKCSGFICRIWQSLKAPPTKTSLGLLIIIVFVATSLFWGGFHYSMEATNTEEFCLSCHEMENFVFQEYKETNHYSNRTGVRATCPDCHVPKSWPHKMARKIKSTKDLWHTMLRTIDTPEKYEARRLHMAETVWADMEASDSRECRNCHDYSYMNYEKQGEEAAEVHPEGFDSEVTCIECHKGIAHKLPEGYEE